MSSLGFELSDSFVAYLGWLYTWGAPLTLIGESDTQIADAQRELVRIGIDNVTGATTKPVETLTEGTELRSSRVVDLGELAAEFNRSGDGDLVILDVRRADEHRSRHIRGANNIPVHELADRVGDLPGGEIWVHCATGYRASIAASLLDRGGRGVVLIDDDFDNAVDLPFA
jgi:hydroxyacylglutathione hydrolase